MTDDDKDLTYGHLKLLDGRVPIELPGLIPAAPGAQVALDDLEEEEVSELQRWHEARNLALRAVVRDLALEYLEMAPLEGEVPTAEAGKAYVEARYQVAMFVWDGDNPKPGEEGQG